VDVLHHCTRTRISIHKLDWTEEGPDGRKFEAARKGIPVDDDDKEVRRNLRRGARQEAKLLRQARHDHVVGIIKTHFTPEPPESKRMFYITMPYAQCDLGDCVALEGRAPAAPIRTQWFGCLIGALAHVHELGIWHRDIKPSNILVRDRRTVLLADFGISKVVWRDTAAREQARAWSGPRRLGLVIPADKAPSGTPGYIAPEAEVWESTAGLPADIFSLGRTFLEMVAAALSTWKLFFEPKERPSPRARYDEHNAEQPKQAENKGREDIIKIIDALQKSLLESLPSSLRSARAESGLQLSELGFDCADIHDLGIIEVCRQMVDQEPHKRPTADDLWHWWRYQLRSSTEALERECECACNAPAGGGADWWRYPDLDYRKPDTASLKRAYENGHRLMAERLQRRGAEMESGAALVAAARGALWDRVKELTGRLSKDSVTDRDNTGRTALHYLAGAGDLEGEVWNDLAGELLKKGADVLARDVEGRTPLRIAAESGIPDMIWQLLRPRASKEAGRRGGQGDDESRVGSDLVMLLRGVLPGGVVENDKIKICRREIESGLLSCDCSNEGEAPGADAYRGILPKKPEVWMLFDAAKVLEEEDNNGQTLLSIAAAHGHEAVVRLLLGQGADVNSLDHLKRDPLSMAAAYGHDGVASLLVDWHAAALAPTEFLPKAVDRKDENGQTPLFRAAERGYAAVVRLLLDRGADAAAADNSEETPLERASTHGHNAVVRLLLEDDASATVDDEAVIRETVNKGLYKACHGGHWSTARILSAHSGQDQSHPSGLNDQYSRQAQRIWEHLKSCRAALMAVLLKTSVGDLVWMAVAMGIAALVIAVGALSGLRLHLLLPYYSSVPMDRLLGWKLDAATNRTRI
jgi:ankyrin repeat protein/serine/threonine protein kinase